MKHNNSKKKDFVFVDHSTRTPDLHELRAFSNATFYRNQDLGLLDSAPDKEILDKISTIALSGEYRTTSIFTGDKGGDGDTTFTTPYDKISIVYSKDIEKNIKKWRVHDLAALTGSYWRLLGDKIEKIKKEKYTGKIIKLPKKYKGK